MLFNLISPRLGTIVFPSMSGGYLKTTSLFNKFLFDYAIYLESVSQRIRQYCFDRKIGYIFVVFSLSRRRSAEHLQRFKSKWDLSLLIIGLIRFPFLG